MKIYVDPYEAITLYGQHSYNSLQLWTNNEIMVRPGVDRFS